MQTAARNAETLQANRAARVGIPYHRFGRAIRYDIRDVEAYLEASRVRTSPAAG